MNTKNNKRRQASQEKIEKAFIELLQTKELSAITVSEIVKKTKLNRSTFYANYADLYALADTIREKLEMDVAQLYKDDRDNKVNSNDYLRLFYHIQSNPLFYKTYFKLGYDGQYKIHLYDTQQAETYFGNKHIAYHMEFFMNEIIHSEYQGREIVR